MTLVLCRWDSRCMEEEQWQAAEGVASLPMQPFYHVLIDSRDRWPNTRAAREHPPLPGMAYVPQELLDAPQVRLRSASAKQVCDKKQAASALCEGLSWPCLRKLPMQTAPPDGAGQRVLLTPLMEHTWMCSFACWMCSFACCLPSAEWRTPQGEESWASKHGGDPFAHPWCMELFLGKDENGDYIPVRQLRDRFRQQREDIHPKGGTDPDTDSPP